MTVVGGLDPATSSGVCGSVAASAVDAAGNAVATPAMVALWTNWRRFSIGSLPHVPCPMPLTPCSYLIRMDGSPNRIQVLRTSASLTAALATSAASPTVIDAPP